MAYRDKVVSEAADIHEGLLETSEESQEREAEFAARAAAEEAEIAELHAKAIEDIVQGIDWASGEQMNLTEWSEELDAIKATPEQRRLYDRAKLDAGTSRYEFFEDYFEEDCEDLKDLDRYPEGDYNGTP